MNWKQLSQSIERYADRMTKWIGYILAAMIALGFVSNFFEWGNRGPFAYLRDNIQVLWLLLVTTAVFTLWIWTSRLHRRFVSGFSDNFRGDLRSNWDFKGPWRIAEEGTLLVAGFPTGDNPGGMTKVGAQWENYTFTFKARIRNQCLGVVVRAQDLNNYYMFQIRTDKIRPHRRAAVPVVELAEEETSPQPEEAPRMLPIKFKVGWQLFNPPMPLNPPLDDWFDVRVIVRGQSVLLRIDDELVFQRDAFLQIPAGKVGFRNAGSEEALVRNVKVTLQP